MEAWVVEPNVQVTWKWVKVFVKKKIQKKTYLAIVHEEKHL